MMKIVRVPFGRAACLLMALLPPASLAVAGCTAQRPASTFDPATLNVLTCRDSIGQQGAGAAPARLINGVDGFIGDANPGDTLPPTYLAGQRYLAWKTALSVAPSARPYRTVSVSSPASARLNYALVGRPSQHPSRRVRLPVCGHRYTLYVGGIFVTGPACVILTVTGPGSKPQTVAVPVLVAKC